MILAAMMLMTLTAKAISYGDAKSEALFLSDKMVYELDLTDEQYEAVYEINLDYLLCVNNPDDLFGICWERRNADLRVPWVVADNYCITTTFFIFLPRYI